MRKILVILSCLIAGSSVGQNNCDSLFSVADKMYQNLGADAALPIFDKILKLNCGDRTRALNNRGTAYNSIKQYGKATKDFDEVLKIDPNNSTAYANKAATCSYLRKYSEAIKLVDKAITLSPDYYLYYKMRADIKGSSGLLDDAIGDYQKCVSLNKTYVEPYLTMAQIYYDTKRYDKTEVVFDSLFKNNPDKPELVERRAYFYLSTHQYPKAIADYSRVVMNDSTDVENVFNLGLCYDLNKDTVDAINLYTKSLQLKENVLGYANRGRLYKKMGQYVLAISDIRNALRLDPTYAQAYLILGNCYLELHDKSRAIDAYEKGLADNPPNDVKYLIEHQLMLAKGE